jgi:bifunctional DNase/RNase
VVRLDVLQVSKLQGSEECLLVLREHGGERLLPITIGQFEAHAIAQAANRVAGLRPSTHDLLAVVVGRLRAALERVVIHDLRDETFYCQLELRGDRGLLEIDCRTSDAVALALRTDSPVFATEEVLARAAVLPRQRADAARAELEGEPGDGGGPEGGH